VSAEQLREALARQKENGLRLGETLLELGHIGDDALAQTLSQQLSVPWVSLARVDFSRELLNLITAELASSGLVVPIYVRTTRLSGQTLFVAIDDPLNEKTLAAVAAHAGMSVKPMVASQSELRQVIRIYYGVEMPELVQRVLHRPSMSPLEIDIEITRSEPAPKRASRSQPPKPGLAKGAAIPKSAALPKEAAPARRTSEAPARRTSEVPPRAASERPKKKRRMLTLTLLDGTTVALPATRQASAPKDERLTTRDLILALDARAQGKDVKTVLDGATWESLFSTLLSVLLRKGLLADWEFVEEWEKHPSK
jgi:type IV pilus assembly protein PilB